MFLSIDERVLFDKILRRASEMSEESVNTSENSEMVEREIEKSAQEGNMERELEQKQKKRQRRMKRTSRSSMVSSSDTMMNAESMPGDSETPTIPGRRPKVKRLRPRGVIDVASKDSSKESLRLKKAELKKINDELFYTKLISALIVGVALGLFIYITDLRDLSIFIVFSMVALLLIVIYIRYIRKIPEDKLSWFKLYLSGTFTYLIVIVVVSSLVWMFLTYFLKGPIPRPETPKV